MIRRDTRGFTLMELLITLLVGGLLFLSLAGVAESVGRVGAANRHSADARALESAVENVFRRALSRAGQGVPSSPNLSGIGVQVATRPDGTPADTLVVLEPAGDAARLSARPCGGTACLSVAGSHAERFTEGQLVLVGTRPTGFAVLRITAPPRIVHAPCDADCEPPVVCPVVLGPPRIAVHVTGSVRLPGGARSAGPCPAAFLPDGSRCAEILDTVALGPQLQPSCRAAPPPAAFTEIAVEDRTAQLGFHGPVHRLGQGGAGALPYVRILPIRASRFWGRGTDAGDSVLVRQRTLPGSGEWSRPVPVAGPVLGLQVETLHPGHGWLRGSGVTASDLAPVSTNPNYVRTAVPGPLGTTPGFRHLRGHHTIAAARVRVILRVTSAQGLAAHRERWIVAATPGLLAGGNDAL